MIAIITGDIIHSKKTAAEIWLPVLEKSLSEFGEKPVFFDIYRGDSFQLETKIENTLIAVLHIISAIKQLPKVDVRMSIGIGEKEYQGKSITTSNGSAFVNSGESFEQLGKKKLGIKTPVIKSTNQLQAELQLVRALTEKWTANMCETILCLLNNPKLNQTEIAEILGKPQSQISRELKAASFYEIMDYVKTANQKFQDL
jgi:hypothetical protein